MDAQVQEPGLVRGEGLTAWRQIADALTADIAAGLYAAGQQLPTESALAARFVVLDEADHPTSGAGYDEWEGLLAHLGVLTPPRHRRSGRATVAAALATNDALDAGLVPQWRARTANAASRALARNVIA